MMKTVIDFTKSLLDKIVDFLDSVARARAASELAKHGYYHQANRLINEKSIKQQ